jgi:bifunctional non-homologous end joining protein LigD
MALNDYWRKRDFKKTKEPSGKAASRGKSARARKAKALSFVIQKHDASHLHYDFRLEFDGVLKSWSIPKGPSLDPADKRLAVEVEDHPLDYASFEGVIPAGEYGGGDVIVWDRGTWESEKDIKDSLKVGRLEFELKGEKLEGSWVLIRTGRPSKKPQWLLIKRHDEFAKVHEEYDVIAELGHRAKQRKIQN